MCSKKINEKDVTTTPPPQKKEKKYRLKNFNVFETLFLSEFRKPRAPGGLSVLVVGPARATADMELELQAAVTFCNSSNNSSSSQSLAVSLQFELFSTQLFV